jgi:hypothetical protein
MYVIPTRLSNLCWHRFPEIQTGEPGQMCPPRLPTLYSNKGPNFEGSSKSPTAISWNHWFTAFLVRL